MENRNSIRKRTEKEIKPKKTFFWIRIVILIAGIGYLFPGFVKEEPIANYDAQQMEEDYVIKSDMQIEQKFKCQGKGLQTITLYVTNAYEGDLTVSVTDKHGKEVQSPYTFTLSNYQKELLTLSVNIGFEAKEGKTYILHIAGSDINSENAPCIKMTSAITGTVRVDDKSLQKKICLQNTYESYYDIGGMLLAILGAVLIGSLGLVEFKLSKEKWLFIREILLIVIAVGSFMIIDVINYEGDAQSFWRIFINIVPVYMLERVLLIFTNSLKVTGIVTSVLSFILSLANYLVCLFRGRPIMPWDLTALGTAATVAGEYTFEPELKIIWAFLLMMLMIQLGCMIQYPENSEQTMKNVIRRVCANGLIVICCLLGYQQGIYPMLEGSLWDMGEVYNHYGIVGGFIAQSRFAGYSKPEGYTKEKAENILNQVKIEKADPTKTTAENIIVIMNESFADFRVIGKNALEGDYMPYIDSLTGNVLKGNLYVSTFGGGTADTEFEVLSGVSCAYVPATPYETLINQKMDSLVTTLKNNSYYAEAFHPYLKENWSRDEAYAFLGFDEYNAIEDMEISEADYVRWCVSDYRDYQEVIKAYEENDENKFFMFNVTMQNHGGYTDAYENFPDTVDLSAYGEFEQAETFLSLVKESDKQLKTLIDYFSNVEEPTLICFFGDHQPYVEDTFYEMLIGKEMSEWSEKEAQQRYITPVVLWSNYEMNPVNIEKISPNYLGALILKQANISMSPYESFMWKLYQEYPVISRAGFWDENGQFYGTRETIDSELLDQYSFLQYYRMMQK